MNSETSPKTLTRSSFDRMIGGVAGGVASYFGLDSTLVRVGFVATTVITGGGAILAYFVMLAIMPSDRRQPLPV
jgi:phage shock protein PspC (stress-responsive transcriptional regulator)